MNTKSNTTHVGPHFQTLTCVPKVLLAALSTGLGCMTPYIKFLFTNLDIHKFLRIYLNIPVNISDQQLNKPFFLYKGLAIYIRTIYSVLPCM